MTDLIKILRNVEKIKDEFDVVGMELRDRRTSLALTLVQLSENLCSISYISKIENNKIMPTKYYLSEICHRLKLDDDQIEILLNLKSILMSCVECYFNEEYLTIKNYYFSAKGLCNYRFKIIEMIYYVTIKDISSATKNMLDLMKLANCMNAYDLYVFSLFTSIIDYYNQSYTDSLAKLNALKKKNIDDNIRIIADKYTYLVSISLNKPTSILEYHKYKNVLVSKGLYKDIEYVNYTMCIYLLRNNEYLLYKDIYKSINDFKYKYSLICRLRNHMNLSLNINEKWVKYLDNYSMMLYLLKNNKDDAASMLEGLKNDPQTFEFNSLFFEYCLLDDESLQYNFIYNKILPKLEITKESYYKDYFLKELAHLSDRVGKYKLFSSACRALL